MSGAPLSVERADFLTYWEAEGAAYARQGDYAWMAAQVPGGWPEIMAANHALAVRARDTLAAALGVAPPAPDAMLGSMASLPLPGVATDAAARALHDALIDEDGIEVPIPTWPVRAARMDPDDPPSAALVRISAQRYVDDADIDRLASALARRVPG